MRNGLTALLLGLALLLGGCSGASEKKDSPTQKKEDAKKDKDKKAPSEGS